MQQAARSGGSAIFNVIVSLSLYSVCLGFPALLVCYLSASPKFPGSRPWVQTVLESSVLEACREGGSQRLESGRCVTESCMKCMSSFVSGEGKSTVRASIVL